MAQVYIIAGVIVLVSVLICYIFIRQTIVKRQKEKARLHRALEKRSKELVQMLNSFPANFLPRDLSVFLYRCIVDVYEQLSKLMPEETEFIENFKLYTGQMESAMRTPATNTSVTFTNSSQINEVRQYLNYFGRFLQTWMQRGNISSKQYGTYKGLIKQLVVQLMVDNYVLSAKQSTQMDKPKLAIHYYMLAKNLITKEGVAASRKGHLALIEEELSSLEKRVAEEARTGEGSVEEVPQVEENEEESQWKQFEEDSGWKKKNIYD